MLIEEAKWFRVKLQEMPCQEIFPLLNVGSSTLHFRQKNQPWIDEYIFKWIAERGHGVVHLDIKKAAGVDLVGDFTDTAFLNELAGMQFKSILCSNLFEHIHKPEELAAHLVSILPDGGYIFASCPYAYPFHADPIDTGFRPGVEEMVTLFSGTDLMYGEIITGGTYWDYITLSGGRFVKTLARLLVPLYHPRVWYSHLNHLPWLWRTFQATCIMCKKTI